jgi:hypothetical protein
LVGGSQNPGFEFLGMVAMMVSGKKVKNGPWNFTKKKF